MLLLDTLEPNQLAILSALIAVELAEDKTLNEMNLIGDLLIGIGSVMVGIAAQRQNQLLVQLPTQQESQQQSPNVQEQIQHLQDQLEEIKIRIG